MLELPMRACRFAQQHLKRTTLDVRTRPLRLQQGIHRGFASSAPSPPQIDSCPSPTCSCRETPDGLDIERNKPLAGTMASYHEQVVVCTGRSDWPSKIEDDDELPLVQGLKKALGGKGRFFNPFHNVLVTASSLSTPANTSSSATALLFPSFRTITLSEPDSTTIDTLIKGYILAPTLEWRLPTPPPNPASLVRDPELSSSLPSTPLSDLTILVCGHGSRDSRCGIMSPLLEAEFADKLSTAGYSVGSDLRSGGDGRHALVGAISHVGGHKYAGNVIVYVPPSWQHPLAGCGVWYGRVEPKHVEGIVKETVGGGRVIKELFRGGIDAERRPIFLDG